MMILVLGWFRLDSDSIPTMISAAAENAAATNLEEGCLLYNFGQDISDPNLFHVQEHWRSEESLQAHFKTPHIAKFNIAISKAKIETMDVRVYSAEEERILLQR